VEQHSYDWRADDLLVWVRFNQPITGTVLSLFRLRVAERMHALFPRGQPFDDWLVVLQCAGETLGQIAWHDTPPELEGDDGEI